MHSDITELSTIGEVIRHHGHLGPNQPAIVATGFKSLSYNELCNYIADVRNSLRRAGFGRDARIAIALQSGPQAALTTVAISCSAVAVPIDTRLAIPEVDKRLAVVRPAAVILLKDNPSATRTVARHQGLPIIEAVVPSGDNLALRLLMPEVGAASLSDEPAAEAPAVILQTSGTTGEPKLIPYSHSNALAAASRVQTWFKLTRADRCLSAGPIYYSHGLKVTVLTPLITGGSIAFPANASTLDFSELFTALKPTWYSAGPTLHRYILDKAKSLQAAHSLHCLRFIVSGGAPLPQPVYEGLQAALGVAVLEHYGLSEAAQISANLLPPGPAKAGTCGIPEKGIVKIAGEGGCELAADEKGEVYVRGPTVMSGYLEAPALNETSFSDGWFRTGDLGSLDKDGFLTLYGRRSELINRGAEKIAPLEIDDALMRHPEVLEAAAFAVPHPRLGQDVAAAVVLSPGSTISPDELRRFLSSQLAEFKIPRRILLREQLPKGLTGKVQRQRLGEN